MRKRKHATDWIGGMSILAQMNFMTKSCYQSKQMTNNFNRQIWDDFSCPWWPIRSEYSFPKLGFLAMFWSLELAPIVALVYLILGTNRTQPGFDRDKTQKSYRYGKSKTVALHVLCLLLLLWHSFHETVVVIVVNNTKPEFSRQETGNSGQKHLNSRKSYR